MKTLNSKRFWLNVLTTLTMLGAVLVDANLKPETMKWVTMTVAGLNIILQVFFNQEKKGKI